MKILSLLTESPVPPVTGTKVRNFHLWPAVQGLGHEVRVLVPSWRNDPTVQGPPGVRADVYVRRRQSLPVRAWNALNYSYHQWPVVHALRDAVDRIDREWSPDVIHAEELRMAYYLPALRGKRTRAVQTLALHNVESDLLRTLHSGRRFDVRGRLQEANLRRYERRAVAAVDRAFAYSALDLQRYRELYPTGRWSTTSGGADARGITPAPQPAANSLLIVGSLAYLPNVRGLRWFFEEVRQRLSPDISITVAGSHAGPEVRALLGREAVNFIDTPPDLAPLYASHAVCAVPLLDGSGTRGRVIEAMAHERLLVTTTKGAEGLGIEPGHGVVECDEPAAFADAIHRYIADAALRKTETARGRAWVMRRYDWSAVASALCAEWGAMSALA